MTGMTPKQVAALMAGGAAEIEWFGAVVADNSRALRRVETGAVAIEMLAEARGLGAELRRQGDALVEGVAACCVQATEKAKSYDCM